MWLGSLTRSRSRRAASAVLRADAEKRAKNSSSTGTRRKRSRTGAQPNVRGRPSRTGGGRRATAELVLVAETTDRHDPARVPGIVLDLVAQALHVDVEGLR